MLLAYNLSNLVRMTLNLHSEQAKPMTKSGVLAICKLIELLKCIQYTFHRQSMTVATYITHIVNHYELNLLMGLDASIVSFYCIHMQLPLTERSYVLYVWMMFAIWPMYSFQYVLCSLSAALYPRFPSKRIL